MKAGINFTDYLNSCLKREPSLKSTANLKMGLTVNTFHTNNKTGKKHIRTKTDQLCAPETMSTTSIFVEGKLKSYDQQKKRKKTQSQVQLKKTTSFKVLDPGSHYKSSSTYKTNIPSKESRAQVHTIKSIQKIRRNIEQQANPESAQEQLKNISLNEKKNGGISNPLTNQYHLLSSELLQTIKKLQKKHSTELTAQKQTYEKRQQKLIQKMMEIQKKNQRCTTLINQLRKRNIDVDSIWHEEKLGSKVTDLMEKN